MTPSSAPPAGSPNSAQTPAVAYDARLGLFSGTMLVVGGVIGAGIFRSPSEVAQRLGTSSLTLSAWALGAVVALIGGFIYAELGARAPRAGGTYIYLRDTFGTLPAFMYGWAVFFMIGSGAIAAVATTGAGYGAALLGLDASTIRPLAIGIVLVLTLLNILGVQVGAVTGNVLTLLKLGAIAALVVAALLLSPSHPNEAPTAAAALMAPKPPVGLLASILAMSAALVPVLFSFGGWQQTNAVAEELKDPVRTLPRAMIFGVLVVVATYLLVNVAYIRALGVGGLAVSSAPAGDAMAVYLGPTGRVIISAAIVISTLGFNCLVILMSARVYQAMAADGLFFASMARLHPKLRTPVAALVAQAIVIVALLLSGTYGQLLDYVVFADWVFFGTTAATLFVWRKRDRVSGAPTPTFLTPWHPWSTLVFIAAAFYVVVGSVASNPRNAMYGILCFAVGVPVYVYWNRTARPASSSSTPRS